MRKPAKLRKNYEKRVDLTVYCRLLRFIHWMNPVLSAEDVLRMLPEVDKWKAEELTKRARVLRRTLESLPGRHVASMELVWGRSRTVTLEEFVPYIVIGRWPWPTWPTVPGRMGARAPAPIRYPLPEALGIVPPGDLEAAIIGGLLHVTRYANYPVLLEGDPPTTMDLCKLASELRETIHAMLEQGVSAVAGRIADEIEGRVIKTFHCEQSPQSKARFFFLDEILDNDFRAYCFWVLARLLAEGHGWRIACCAQCQGFFLRARRDPPNRPSRFCSDQCRRDWHNPRRPKKGNPR
jgi:hypothetical protein